MRVILAAGGSGGHIFPSIAVASELEKAGVKDIFFVSSKRRLDKNILKEKKDRCFFLSVNPMPLRFNLIRYFVFLWKVLLDAVTSVYLIIKLRPDIVVGFGGYASGTIVRIAGLFKIPVIIHEQNLLPGRANKILSSVADKIAVSFEGSSEYFPDSPEKVVFSGNPIRLDMLSTDRSTSARELGLSEDKLTVLIMGGSQGSTFLNKTASEAAKIIKKEKGDAIQFIHLTGKKDHEEIMSFYKDNDLDGRVFSFLERIDEAYALSDIAISRAGAAALFELAYYAKPMILVPYPNPKNNQRQNAVYFSNAGAAVYKEEKDLTPDVLAREVLEIITDVQRMEKYSKAAKDLSVPDAGKRLAEEIVKLGGAKGIDSRRK